MNEEFRSENGDYGRKSSKLPVVLLTIIVLVLLGVVAFLLNDKYEWIKLGKKSTDNKTEEKDTKKQETEVDINKYQYLIDNLSKGDYCGLLPVEEYLDMTKLSDKTKFFTAINNLEKEKISVKVTDDIDVDKERLENLKRDFGSNLEEITEGYGVSSIDKEIKKIYGNNTKITYKSFIPLIYDKTNNVYFVEMSGCSHVPTLTQVITKASSKNNELYLYTLMSYSIYEDQQVLYYDYVSDDNNTNVHKVLESNIDEKYFETHTESGEVSKKINIKKYMLDNQDKFAKYKYTFEKENDNYIFKKLEKID